MKQLIHLTIFLAFWGDLAAQRPYQPMVVEGATWVQQQHDNQFSFPQQFAVRIMKDTTIDSINYNTLYSIPIYQDTGRLAEKILLGFLREDTVQRQVFYRSASQYYTICFESIGTEVLLYDFLVKIGDTAHICMNNNPHRPDWVIRTSYVNQMLDIPIFGLDSLLLVELTDTSFLRTDLMYFEAVGNAFGPLGITPVLGYDFAFTDRALIKYCRNDSLCGLHLVTSLNKPNPPISIIAHSNIVDPGQNINLNYSVKSLSLITLAGKIIHIEQNDSSFSIPSSCCSGVYVLKGVDHYGNTFSQKIIVR